MDNKCPDKAKRHCKSAGLLCYVLSMIFNLVNSQSCPSSNQPLPKEYLYPNLKDTTLMINDYALITSSNAYGQSDNYLFLRKNNGNMGIFNAETSSILYSFYIENESPLIAWDFLVDSKINCHTLDKSGNVYEVDGNYGSLSRKYSNTITGTT